MKKVVALFITFTTILQAMVPAGEMTELLKLPDLLEHYREHTRTDNSLSFVEFVNLHYGDTEQHDKQHSHDRLPFADHHHNCQLHQLVYTLPEQIPSPSATPVIIEVNSNYNEVDPSSLVTSIWQPPRIA